MHRVDIKHTAAIHPASVHVCMWAMYGVDTNHTAGDTSSFRAQSRPHFTSRFVQTHNVGGLVSLKLFPDTTVLCTDSPSALSPALSGRQVSIMQTSYTNRNHIQAFYQVTASTSFSYTGIWMTVMLKRQIFETLSCTCPTCLFVCVCVCVCVHACVRACVRAWCMHACVRVCAFQ